MPGTMARAGREGDLLNTDKGIISFCEAVARTALGEPAGREGAELLWRCPHGEKHQNSDQHPSLKINPQKDKWGCFVCGVGGKGGWSLAAFIAGLSADDKPAVKSWLQDHELLPKRGSKRKTAGRGPVVQEFIHHDEKGNPICKKRRHEPGEGGKPKDYTWQRFEDGKWLDGLGDPPIVPPLYNVPAVLAASKIEPIFLFESHTDVRCASSMGLVATTSGGVNSWQPAYADVLAGRTICLVPDNDEPGARFAAIVCPSLRGKVASLKVVSIAPYPDFRRWADAQGEAALDRLFDLYGDSPEWQLASGAELIRRLEDLFSQYIIASKGVPLIVALYSFMTWCFQVFSWIGYLSFLSPAESCGKSHAADIVGWASAHFEILVSVTQAALFRLIEKQKPTVVVDEAEVLQGDGETAIALNAVLHAGNAPDDAIIRCAPNTYEVERFVPWCPKIFCAIGKLPRTLASRCIAIEMKRRKKDEKVRPFIRRRIKGETIKLGAEIAAWVLDHESEIQRIYESLPDSSFEDRGAENFAPLEAILTVADPDRLLEFRRARLNLTEASNADLPDDAISVRLFLDIKTIFEDKHAEDLPSKELVEALTGIETSPWGEWSKGKPLSQAKLARLLKPFHIYPGQIQNGQARGYKLSEFQDSFTRYLPTQSVKVSESQYSCGFDADFKVSNKIASDTLENAVSDNNHAGLRHFDTLDTGNRGGATEKGDETGPESTGQPDPDDVETDPDGDDSQEVKGWKSL